MCEQISSFVICVVGDYEALREILVAFVLDVQVIVHYEFQALCCFAAGSCAHVEDRVVGLDVCQDWRHHAYDFLSGQNTCIFGAVNQLMDLLHSVNLFQQIGRHHQLVDQVAGIVPLAIHFER